MATLILVRHGRSTANTSGVLAGRTPGVSLDERGAAQAAALPGRLADVPLAAVVSSPSSAAGRPYGRSSTLARTFRCTSRTGSTSATTATGRAANWPSSTTTP